MKFYRKWINSSCITAPRLQGNAPSTVVQRWAGNRGKRFSVRGNGPSQTVSPQQQPELNTLPTTRWYPTWFGGFVCVCVCGGEEEMERHPKHTLNVTHIWSHRDILYTKVYLQQKDLLIWLSQAAFSLPWHVGLSSSATYSPKISTKKEKRKKKKTCTHTHT